GEKSNKFKKRIFIQYFWRSEKPHDRALVTKEYLDFRVNQAGSSPRTSLVPPPTSAVLKKTTIPDELLPIPEARIHGQPYRHKVHAIPWATSRLGP
ncbi:hypothetical protein NECAME_14073, partial [Necator americanus]